MAPILRHTITAAKRFYGPSVHLLWVVGVIFAAISVHQTLPFSLNALCGWACAIIPGIIGLGMSSRLNPDSRRFVLTLAWVLPVFAATAAALG